MTTPISFFAGGYSTLASQRHLLIPNGIYEAEILCAGEERALKTDTLYLRLCFGVEVARAKWPLHMNIMLAEGSARALETGRRQLDYLCAAVGLDVVMGPAEFVAKLLLVEVRSYTDKDTGVRGNRVRRMLPITVAYSDEEEDR